ncbi:MAG: tat (twin-arginine translocation) pathway signal sequence, partial [Planctomycetia bacterium]|nr:tat (twin-arginine translocation) pathway signal sequence [Planctomycetia bacterium]
SNGPRGKSENDVVMPKVLFASTDIVAIDTAATAMFNQIVPMPLEDVKYIGYGAEMNLGTTELAKLNVKRIKL